MSVAVVRGDRRRGAVAQALALIADDLRARITSSVLIKPRLAGRRLTPAATHPDTLSAVFDAVMGLGAESITVVEGATGATAAFRQPGYLREAWGRPVRFLDLDRDEDAWEPLEWTSADGSVGTARLSATVVQSGCRISVAPAGTGITPSLGNMISTLHPCDRMETRRGTPSTLSDESLGRNLMALWRRARPHVSVVDGFDRVGTIVAGTDPVATDAVASAILGLDPRRIPDLQRAQAAGLGIADLGRIRVLGDSIARRAGRPRHLSRSHGPRGNAVFAAPRLFGSGQRTQSVPDRTPMQSVGTRTKEPM